MKRVVLISLLGTLAASTALAQNLPPEVMHYADTVLYNGKVLTVDKDNTVAQGIALRDGKVLAVGNSADIRKFAGPKTRQIDLAGKSVVPGFIDSDGDNAFAGGDLYKDTMVNGVVGKKVRAKTVPEMLAQVRELVGKAKPGSPVFVRMADEFRNDLSKLNAKDLDQIAPNNPIMLSLSSSDGVVNTSMLEKAFANGLSRDHFQVVKDKDGKPTGQLFSQAIGFVGWNMRDWPELTEDTFNSQADLFDSFIRGGVTTVTGHGSGYSVTIISQMYHNNRLDIRVRPSLDFARQNPMADQILRRIPNLLNFSLGDGMVRIVGAAAGPVDGASDDGGILTNEPKNKIPTGIGGTLYGANKWTAEQWTGKQWVSDLTPAEKRQTEWNTLQLFRKHGWNISGNHNMGSAAAVVVMEGLMDAEKQPDIKVKAMLGRNSLDHNIVWDAKSIALAKQIGDRMAFGLNSEIWSQRVVRGEEMLSAQFGDKLNTMQPVKTLLAAGLNVHFEGGKPEQPPLWRIQRFVTRTDKSTRSENSGKVWGKDQALDRKEALRMVTINAARFIAEENMLGSLEKGKYADLVVLNGDYLAVPDDKIDALKPVMTIVDGKVVYEEKSK